MGILSKITSFFPSFSLSDVISSGNSRWWGSSSWSGETLSGEEVTEANLLTSAACFACTKALSETIAGLPSAIMRGMKNRKELQKDQPAWELLVEQPNPEMDSFTFMEMLVARMTNGGNFFAEIQRDRSDRPIALWPIHPSRVMPMREPDGSLYWQISHDYTGTAQYQDPTWRKEHLSILSPHHMLNVVGFGSQNGIISPGITPGMEEIGIDFATRRYGADFFKGGATPAGFVEHPGWVADETKRNNMRSDFNRVHNNKTGAHKIGFIWEGAKYNQIGIAPEQAQFLETRKFTSHRICSMYGVPPAIIGDYQDNKFATADAMIRAFVMITLRNSVVRVEKALNRQVMNRRSGDGRLKGAFESSLIYEIAIDGLLRGDPKTQAETWKLMRDSGVATANDWLADVGMNPVEGPEGEYRIVNGGMARLDKIDNQGNRQKNENKEDAGLAFDKQALIEGMLPLVPQPAQVRGADLNSTLRETAIELADDAIGRIHGIAATQIGRWREQDPKVVESKLPEFWQKQHARLLESLAPCDKVAKKINPDSNLAQDIADCYKSDFETLDNYDVFDDTKTAINYARYHDIIEEATK